MCVNMKVKPMTCKQINKTDFFMLGREEGWSAVNYQVCKWVVADHMNVIYVSCFSCQCSQRPQLPGLHPTVEQPKWIPVHPPCLEEGGLRPLHGPHLLPDGLLLRQPVSRRGKLCAWPLLQLVLKCRPSDYTEREREKHELKIWDAHKILIPESVSQFKGVVHPNMRLFCRNSIEVAGST